MTTSFDRKQALLKLDEFRDKISKHMQSIATKKQQSTKPYRYVIYEPKKIDISTQTVYDKGSRIKSSPQKQRPQLNDMRRQKRIAQLREIVEDSFKHFFRKTKQKENYLQSQIEHLLTQNQQLQKQIQQKDTDIEQLKENLAKVTQQIQKPINELTTSRELWEIQHKKDLNDIRNLQKGIAEYQKETQRLTAEINKYENDMIVRQKRIKQLQVLYKNSQHLVDVMSEEQVKLSSQLQTLQIQLNQKTSYIQYIENLYFDSLKKEKQLQMEIEYFRDETQTIKQTLLRDKKDVQMVLSENVFYSKLSDSLNDVIEIQDMKLKKIYELNLQTENTMKQDQQTENIIDYSTKLYQLYENEQNHFNFLLEVQKKIAQEQILLEKCKLEMQSEEKQQTLRNIFKDNLKQVIKEKQNYSQQSSKENLKPNQIKDSFIKSSSQSSQENNDLNQQMKLGTNEQIILQHESSHQGIKKLSNQSSHKQIQSNEQQPNIEINNLQAKDSITQVQPKNEEEKIEKNPDLLSPQPLISSYRPPSFGNDNNTDIMPSESDKEPFQTQTPYFTEISSIQSHVRSQSPETFILTQSQQLHKVQHLSNFTNSCLRKKQSPQQHTITQGEDNRFLKDLKGSDEIIYIEHEKVSQQKIKVETLTTPRPNRKNLPQINTNIEQKIPHYKESYCQATVQQNGPQCRQKEIDSLKFIKKHESMTNYIGIHPLSPSCQKQQSDCHLMIEKNKKHPKKKIDFKLPHNENQKVKKNLKDLEKELFLKIQSHNSMWRKLQRDKFNRVLGCPKLSQRLAQLIQKQTSIQQQVIINEHNHPSQITGSLPGMSKEAKQSDHKSDKLLINQELQVMIELQKLIQDTYEWILLVQRLNKREYDKHQRLVGRIKLKKTKTGIHHNPSKQKQTNEDKYESDQLVDLYKEKSVYSEGDSPRVAGDVDHFDISPYEHNEVPEKHQDIHSLEKLFKQGQQISQISSVKNQSQVSSFINARSEFANILYSKNYIKIQDQEVHPSLASANHESIENIYYNQMHLSSVNPAYKHKQQITSPQNVNNQQQFGNQKKYDQKSIKSVRHASSKQKDKIKIMQKRNAQISNYYKKIIEKMKEDEKKKYTKIQKDFNKALTMALKLKSVQIGNNSLTSSIQKEVQPSPAPTSIKIIPNNSQVKSSLSQIKSTPSKLQSKSLTQITLLSQKISEKDEILEQKIESYEKNIDELKIQNQEMKSNLTTKIQLIEQLQKKLKLQKLENQKIQKKSQQLKKEVQLLKTQNKKIKNEFSQFMTKLVTEQKQRTALIMRKLSSSSNDQMKQFQIGIPQLIKYAQSLVFSSGNIQTHVKEKQTQHHEEKQKQPLMEEIKIEETLIKDKVNKFDYSTQTEDDLQQKITNKESQIKVNENSQLLIEIKTKNKQIQDFKQTIKDKDNQISSLTQQVLKLTQENSELQQQIDMMTIQVSQKAVEISQLSNSLKSIQMFQKRLQQKLAQTQNKIKQYEAIHNIEEMNVHETPIKKFNQHLVTQSLIVQDKNKSIQPVTPMSSLYSSQNRQSHRSKSKRKKSHGSLGSMQENFFDLQNQKEFNNIQPSKHSQKDSKIHELQKMLLSANKQIQFLSSQKKKV